MGMAVLCGAVIEVGWAAVVETNWVGAEGEIVTNAAAVNDSVSVGATVVAELVIVGVYVSVTFRTTAGVGERK